MFSMRFPQGLGSRVRKLEVANRHRSRDIRRPIADVLELRLEEHRKYVGDSEIHRSLISYQRFLIGDQA